MTESAAAGDPSSLAIAVLTYHRLDELLALLAGVDRLVGVGAPTVYVVDNDPLASARDLVEDASRRSRSTILYAHEPRPGIAVARNTALGLVRAGGHSRVAFIDDDEVPEPDWLAHLNTVMDRTGAAGVTGPVESVFERPPPQALHRGGFYDRTRHPTGTQVPAAATNNLLLDVAAVDDLSPPGFDDSRFNLTGGEDTDLTTRLRAAGHSLVWSDEAVVRELVPAGRLTWTWALRRTERTGHTAARLMLGARPTPAGRARCLILGVIRVSAGTAIGAARALPGVTGHWASGLRISLRGIGFISAAVGSERVEYRRAAPTPDEPGGR